MSEDQHIVFAASVIVFRDAVAGPPELLMVKRSSALAFAGSAVVFPGGKLESADLELAAGNIETASRIAAIRESLEEVGLAIGIAHPVSAEQASEARALLAKYENMARVLDHLSWTLDVDQLVPFARWLPNFKPGRIFDTRFYLANIGAGVVQLSPDYGENTEVFWISATEALTAIEARELKAIYPTRRNLERLAQFNSFSAACDHAITTPPVTISPWIVKTEAGDMLCINEGAGYPVTSAPVSQIHLE